MSMFTRTLLRASNLALRFHPPFTHRFRVTSSALAPNAPSFLQPQTNLKFLLHAFHAQRGDNKSRRRKDLEPNIYWAFTAELVDLQIEHMELPVASMVSTLETSLD